MMGFVGVLKFSVKCLDILAWPVFGLGYPLYASILAIETNSNSDTQKLIAYWVSISVVLLFEHSFWLQWLVFWPYIKLMIVGYLVLPYFHGSLYVYKHLVHPCLSMGPRIVTCKLNKLELFFKKDDFLVEVKRYMKENGSDALEDLIASTKKSAKPNVAVNEIRAVAAEDSPKFEQPILPVQYKDSNAFEITEKIEEVASTKQLKSEQPKHPVRFEDSNSVEVPEKKEVASTAQLMFEQPELPVVLNDSSAAEKTEKREVTSTKQVRQIESNTRQTENRTLPPLESINTGTTTEGGRDLSEILPPENVLKAWTCAICQVTTQSEAVLNSHLQGSRHKAACERLKVNKQIPKSEPPPVTTATTGVDVTCVVCQLTLKSHEDVSSHLQGKRHKRARELLNSKNQASSSNVSPASVGKKANFPETKPEKFTINNSDPPENRIPEAKKQENLMESRFVEIRNSKWWCTICNISCTCEEHMQIHLNAKKHLARMRALDGAGSGVHA
ncbi:HVA22-LIKE PROTEINS [Salix purpurea]|uniref:HVA22-LIKE PROTEINS n=1 Tax=Salix purpurea TaxID=77065 RepID=A0A9Q0PQQ0_SALPP|nr:HVA22-LIKE PROTEINS [Salix purpurea]